MNKIKSALCCGLAVGSILLCGAAANAQSSRMSGRVVYDRQTGEPVQQIDGEEAPVPAPAVEPEPAATPAPQAQQYEYDTSGQPGMVYGDYCPDCQTAGCPTCAPRPGFGFRVRQFVDWFNPCGMCTHSPDHGFCPPAKRPIYRQPVAYQNYYAQQAAAQQAGYNQVNPAAYQGYQPTSVYWPTDTTQLGYYYQQVPQWWPNRDMYPPVPNPNAWHQHACGPNCGPCGTGTPNRVGARPVILPYPGAAGYCPSCQQGYEQQMEAPTQDQEGVVPAPSNPTPAEANLRPLYSQPALVPLTR